MEAAKNINQTKKDILGSLPPEIVQDISLYLTPESLEKASACNQLWNKLLNLNYYWYKQCQARGYNELKDTSKSAIYEKYLVRFPTYWQMHFNYNQLQINWTNDIFTTTSVGPNSFNVLYYFDDEVLIAADESQNKIFIINSCTGEIKNTILLPKRIFRIIKHHNLLVIVIKGKSSKYLQVLTIEGKLLYAKKVDDLLTGDEFYAIRLKVHKTLIAINEREGDLHIIDFEKKIITYKSANVCYVCFGDEIIVVGKTRGLIEILDMNYNRLRRFNHGAQANINKIMIFQDYMVSLADNPRSDNDVHTACVWNLKENVFLHTIKGISIENEGYNCSIYQDKFIYIKNARIRTKCKIVGLDLSTGNKIFDIIASWFQIGTSFSNGHYIFVTTITKEKTDGTAYIHCAQSGKEITSINDIYDDVYSFRVGHSCYHRDPLRATETKLAYITNKGDLFIRNYEKFIH